MNTQTQQIIKQFKDIIEEVCANGVRLNYSSLVVLVNDGENILKLFNLSNVSQPVLTYSNYVKDEIVFKDNVFSYVFTCLGILDSETLWNK